MTGARPGRALVIGYGLSGRVATDWLTARDWEVTVIEDNAGVGGADRAATGTRAVELAPGPDRAATLARQADLVVPSPGVPVSHPALVAAEAAGVEVRSEIELAWSELGEQRAGRGARCMLVAITGTNGKTTVTHLVAAMLAASGRTAVAAGNVGYPLLEAARGVGAGSVDALVAEVSSFQLHYTRDFRPDVSCWLNFAPDHLDWHPDLGHYARAKSRTWANQRPGSVVVVNADDPVVSGAAAGVAQGVEVVTFGTSGAGAGTGPGTGSPAALAALATLPPPSRRLAGPPTWCIGPDGIEGPGGFVLKAVDLPRALPHDLANTAAAVAVALAAGASPEGCFSAARTTPPPPHRVQLVGEAGGVAWYDDSKATTPAAVRAAVQGFSSVVLIAGGRNKGLDLSDLAVTVPPVRSVVAIGESAAEVAAAFAGKAPVQAATSMAEAVRIAAGVARPGDAVVLSPGCASFDWYSSYGERGDHFAALVQSKIQEVAHLWP